MRPKMVRRWIAVVGVALCVFVFLLPVFNVTRQKKRVRWVIFSPSDVTQPPSKFKPPMFLWHIYGTKAVEIRELNSSQWILQYSRTRPEEVGMPLPSLPPDKMEGVATDDGEGINQIVAPQSAKINQSDSYSHQDAGDPDSSNKVVKAKGVTPKDNGDNHNAEKKVVTVKKRSSVLQKTVQNNVGKMVRNTSHSTATPGTVSTRGTVSTHGTVSTRGKVSTHGTVTTRSAVSTRDTVVETTTHQNTSDVPKLDYAIKSYLSFPLPSFTRSTVTQSDWIHSLQSYLSSLNSKQISVVTANKDHELLVVNWLISAFVVADKPLDNVLVLSLSKTLYDLLHRKNIPVIFVDPHTVINDYGSRLIRTGFSQIHIVRLTFFRLINHWGFDVVWYDSDAIVLKNPQRLFEKYPDAGLIGSEGRGPKSLYSIWGRTICTGVLLMRSSKQMELYWENMARISKHPFTDQGLVNLALKSQDVTWTKPVKFSDDMEGECQKTKSGIKAVILSEAVICRYTCNEKWRNHYYVWHKPAINRQRTIEKKMERAHDGHAWFLRQDWTKSSTSVGVEWLREISENTDG